MSTPPSKSSRFSLRGRWLAVFLIATVAYRLVTGVLFDLRTPPWQAPDEPRHFEYVRLLWEKGRPISVADTDPAIQHEILQSMMDSDFFRWYWLPRPAETPASFKQIWRDAYTLLHRPSLYYYLSLPFLGVVIDHNTVDQLHMVRLLSVLLGVCTVVVAFYASRALFPGDDFMAVGVTSFVALVPMYAYLSGVYNSDNLVTLTSSVLFLGIALGFQRGLDWRLALFIALTALLGVAAKRIGVFGLVTAAVVPLVYLWGRRDTTARALLGVVALAWLALMASAGIVAFAPSWLPAWLGKPINAYFLNNPKQATKLLNGHYLSWEFVQFLWGYAKIAAQSFWAQFGWMSLSVDAIWYEALKVLHLGAALGLALWLYRAVRGKLSLSSWQWRALGLWLFGSLALGLLAVAEFGVDFWFAPARPTQGRYFFPVIIPFATLFLLGWRELWPRRWRWVGLFGLVAFLFAFNSVCLFWYFGRWFAPL